jgi:tetracycline 7-halogenase / FADH2 O2-dependent halogenase
MKTSYDVTIIGSGLAGSVTALLLSKLGYKTLLVEKDTHPRFALGESSTPIFSKKIRNLGFEYGVQELIDLSSYDRIMASKDPFLCGPKELFQYYVHEPGQTTAKVNGDYPEVIVQVPECDTQFKRSVLDERVMQYARKYGSDYVDTTELLDADFDERGAHLRLQKKGSEPYELTTRFLVDATGFRSLLSRKFDLRIPDAELDTTLRSRCIFTHFETVGLMEDAVEPDPVFNERCTVNRWRATQHHCFDGGWYWFIPFDNGVTSVGINLDMDKYPMNDRPAEEEFWHFTRQYPIVNKMLEGHKTIMPYIKTGRLQFRTRRATGDRWALLTSAAVGMDAWFSVGMGMTLISVHRLVEVLHKQVLPKNDFRAELFQNYENSLFTEWYYITRMVDGMYKSFKHFEIFKSYCFFCFMGAESLVYSGAVRRPHDPTSLMLNVGNPQFVDNFMHIYNRLLELCKKDKVTPEEAEYFRAYLQNEMKSFNFRDYGNPIHKGVYYRVPEAVERKLMEEKMPQQMAPAPGQTPSGVVTPAPAMAANS